jgi:hypothetical protein
MRRVEQDGHTILVTERQPCRRLALDQLAVATGQAAIAATAIHNSLR